MIHKDKFKEFYVVIKSFHFRLPHSTVFKMHGIYCAAEILFLKFEYVFLHLFYIRVN